MPRNGSGTFTLYPGVNPVVTGTTITSTWANNTLSDIATAMTASIANDGQTPILANLPMSTYRHTGVGNGVNRTDYAALGQVQDSAFLWGGTAGGTANALTISLTPVITAYAAGQQFTFIVGAATNTSTTPTINVNSVGAKTIVKSDGSAVTAGTLVAGSVVTVCYDGTNMRITKNWYGNGVCVLDFMTAAQRADVFAGTAAVSITAAVVAALATGSTVVIPRISGAIYALATTIPVTSNSTIVSNRAVIKVMNSTNDHAFTIASGANNVEINGLEINGNKSNNTGGSGIAMSTNGGTDIRIRNNYVHDCSAHGIYTGGTTVYGLDVSGNYCYNNYSGGVTAVEATEKFAYMRNFCWNNGTHGVGILGIARYGTITGNVCWDNGQGTPNADNLTGYNVSNDSIVVSSNVSYGGLNNGIHFGGIRVSYIGNTVYNAAQYGIRHSSNTGEANALIMVGNNVYSSGLSGISIYGSNSGTVFANVSESNTEHGIITDTCTNLGISGNVLRSNTGNGYFNNDLSSFLAINNNIVKGNGGHGIVMAYLSYCNIVSNISNNNTGYGVFSGASETENLVTSNVLYGNTGGSINTVDATTTAYGNQTGTGRITTGTGKIVLDTSPTVNGATVSGNITVSGTIGQGGSPAAGRNFSIAKTLTGAVTAQGIWLGSVAQSDATTEVSGFITALGTQATAFTVPDLEHFYATQGTFGAGSTVTNQYGFYAGSNLTGATNNYGFYSNIASTSGRWNFFANGTANNAFGGNTRLGGTTAPTVACDVTGAVASTTTISAGTNLFAQATKPVAYTLAQSAVQVSHTGDTAKFAFATISIPGGAMGANGGLRVWCQYSYTNSANSKTLSAEYGGTVFWQPAAQTTNGTISCYFEINNRNDLASQVGMTNNVGLGGGTLVTGTISSGSNQNLILYGQLANSGETINLERYRVEVIYGA